MPREIGAPVPARVREARRLWSELALLYDMLDAHVTAAEWHHAAALIPRMQSLEEALRPLIEKRRATTAAHELAAWASLEPLIAPLVDRRERALAAARVARDAVAAELARLHETRASAAKYRGASTAAPLFTSRTV